MKGGLFRKGPAVPLIRRPLPEDGAAVSALIRACPPLDNNSAYCNLLQCTHFAETCALAERDGEIIGWVSGYRPPEAPDELFIWQVAVHASARGLGLGQSLLETLLLRPAEREVATLSTTITPENAASWALFRSFAQTHHAVMRQRPLFERDNHFNGEHETEFLVSIGPLSLTSPKAIAKEAS